MSKSQTLLTNFFASPSLKKPRKLSEPIFNIQSASSPKRSKLISLESTSKQMVLDAGQKQLGGQFCSQCGMVYAIDCPADVEAHNRFHSKVADMERFRITRKQLETFRKNYPGHFTHLVDKSIVEITNETAKSLLRTKLVDIIEEIVNVDFGFAPDISIFGRDGRCTLWAVVVDEGASPLVACVMVSELLTSAQWEDSAEMYKEGPILGVNRIWTHPNWRKKGLALALIDKVRTRPTRFCKMMAFSDPTENGKQLARSISRSLGHEGRFLTYTVSK